MKVTLTAFVYLPKRRRAGKLVESSLYRARVRFPGECKVRDIPLGVTEKRSAEQKLAEILDEKSRESAHLIPSKKAREAAQTPLKTHLARFLQELVTDGCVPRYVKGVETYISTLIQKCDWEYFKDVDAETFELWRQKQNHSKQPKTLNEYLVAARAFCKWAVRLGYIKDNPLAQVKVVRVEGRQKKRDKRTFTPDEFRKLLAVAGKRAGLYLMAGLTGLRRGELKQLLWGDVKLDGENLAVRIRASISKNHRETDLPLHPDLVAALRKMRPEAWQPDQKVFVRLYPGYKRFYADLKAAGIDYADRGEGRLTFHSFRHTFCTQLAMIGGISERVRRELLRHQNPELTAETYTEAKTLQLSAPVNQLNFHRAANDTAIDTQTDAQTGVLASPSVSPGVTPKAKSKSENEPLDMGLKSLSVTACHDGSEKEKWSERQDSNLRLRGPKPRALARLSYAPTRTNNRTNCPRCNAFCEISIAPYFAASC